MIRFMRCHILFCEKTDVYLLPEVDDVSLSHCITLFHRRKKNLALNIPKNQQCRCGRELVSLFKTCGCCQSFALEFHTAVLDLFVSGDFRCKFLM